MKHIEKSLTVTIINIIYTIFYTPFSWTIIFTTDPTGSVNDFLSILIIPHSKFELSKTVISYAWSFFIVFISIYLAIKPSNRCISPYFMPINLFDS